MVAGVLASTFWPLTSCAELAVCPGFLQYTMCETSVTCAASSTYNLLLRYRVDPAGTTTCPPRLRVVLPPDGVLDGSLEYVPGAEIGTVVAAEASPAEGPTRTANATAAAARILVNIPVPP